MAGFRKLLPRRMLALASKSGCMCVGVYFLLFVEKGQVGQQEQRDQPNGHDCQQRDGMIGSCQDYEEQKKRRKYDYIVDERIKL